MILIGVMLVAEGVGAHLDKGYIYFAMFFALLGPQRTKPPSDPTERWVHVGPGVSHGHRHDVVPSRPCRVAWVFAFVRVKPHRRLCLSGSLQHYFTRKSHHIVVSGLSVEQLARTMAEQLVEANLKS